MTGAEELREKMAGEIFGRYGGRIGDSGVGYIVADEILKHLADMGCGIWTKKKLPETPHGDPYDDAVYGYIQSQQDMLEYIDECFEPIGTE